jgi:hypothetical protein
MREAANAVPDRLACQKQPLRAARANRVVRTDEKRIRTNNAVIDKSMSSARVLSEIVDCARMRFSSARNQ